MKVNISELKSPEDIKKYPEDTEFEFVEGSSENPIDLITGKPKKLMSQTGKGKAKP